MVRRKILRLLIFLGLLLGGLALPAGADTPFLPMRGSVELTSGNPLPPDTACPASHHEAEGKGLATHVGEFEVTSSTCGFNARIVVVPPFNPGGEPPYFVADYTNAQTWTAPNGDEVWLSAVGVIVMSLSDGSGGTQATITFEGGTGRFQGAGGTALAVGTGSGAFSFEGTIDYEASNRSNG